MLDILAAVAVAIDHLSNARRRQITDQMAGPPVRFSDRRFASVGGTLVATRVEGTLGNPTKVTFVDAKGIRRTTLDVDADWWPGQPVWTGMVHGKPVSVQVRAILNGYDLAYRGIRTKAYVYTEREAALAALMPEKVAPDTSKLLLCPMPGLVKAIHVAAGQEVKAGEALCVVEAMKMENILQGRARCHRQGRQGQARRQPGRRCRHHGVRLTGGLAGVVHARPRLGFGAGTGGRGMRHRSERSPGCHRLDPIVLQRRVLRSR